MYMKKTLCAIMAAFLLAGCGSSAPAWPGESSIREGMENIGFFDIPKSWIDVSETDDPANITLRFTDARQSPSYSFMTYSYTTKELEDYDPIVGKAETWIEWEVESIEENYGDILTDTVYGTAKVAGCEAQRVDMSFSDDTKYTDVIFVDDEGTLHLLCFETLAADASENLDVFVDYILQSFDTKK